MASVTLSFDRGGKRKPATKRRRKPTTAQAKAKQTKKRAKAQVKETKTALAGRVVSRVSGAAWNGVKRVVSTKQQRDQRRAADIQEWGKQQQAKTAQANQQRIAKVKEHQRTLPSGQTITVAKGGMTKATTGSGSGSYSPSRIRRIATAPAVGKKSDYYDRYTREGYSDQYVLRGSDVSGIEYYSGYTKDPLYGKTEAEAQQIRATNAAQTRAAQLRQFEANRANGRAS